MNQPTDNRLPDDATSQPVANQGASSLGAPQSSSGQEANAAGQPWLDKAANLLKSGNAQDLIRQATKSSVDTWRQLTTPQKLLAGGALALGGWLLLRGGGKAKAAKRVQKRSRKQAKALHELLLFVNDRVDGYRRAHHESRDAELRGYYHELAGKSHEFATRLNTYLRDKAAEYEHGTTRKGKLYRGWMQAKAALTGHGEKAILADNIYGEEWALKAYEKALREPALLGALGAEIERQYAHARQTHARLQQLHAQHPA
ncbi:PA2169 family four-helix-bundle protein [Hymenobacter latericus]|uniref:PA2169 family four-helix-bundle protein n=1 Tax=Hymenobacter sp. YIM 151858-1 TaxID=2987688 RepID=UPI002227EDE5|nr:PA2169 family four-helix-bundle protein [Hymenobacter sp. YIM 151858-1]UYZ58855.1 PA2169 family four-helix-bundle protein [Hymenobacter sp. YIM 151858-1]